MTTGFKRAVLSVSFRAVFVSFGNARISCVSFLVSFTIAAHFSPEVAAIFQPGIRRSLLDSSGRGRRSLSAVRLGRFATRAIASLRQEDSGPSPWTTGRPIRRGQIIVWKVAWNQGRLPSEWPTRFLKTEANASNRW